MSPSPSGGSGLPGRARPVARREWDRLAVELSALRILTNLDRAALAAYCGA
jgi:phage terminase small subunit